MTTDLIELGFKHHKVEDGNEILCVWSKKVIVFSIFVLEHYIDDIKQPYECYVSNGSKTLNYEPKAFIDRLKEYEESITKKCPECGSYFRLW